MNYANEFYSKIQEVCNSKVVKTSGKQMKWELYRGIKEWASYYKKEAEEARVESGLTRISDDEITIHLLSSMVVKNKFTDAMTAEEYKNYILNVTASCMEGRQHGSNGLTKM